MKRNKELAGILILCSVILSSCATYHISTESLLSQFASVNKETKVNYIVAFPFIFPGRVTGNNLRELICLDNTEKEQRIRVTNHTGVRITKKDGRKNTFYFDTLIIQDSTINGAQSHFLGLSIKPIKLRDIEKIELQK